MVMIWHIISHGYISIKQLFRCKALVLATLQTQRQRMYLPGAARNGEKVGAKSLINTIINSEMAVQIFPGWPSHWLLRVSRLAEASIQKVDGHRPRCRKFIHPRNHCY